METNKKMILSLLNLYLSYVDLKTKKIENKPFHSRYATRQLQNFKTMIQDCQVSNKKCVILTNYEQKGNQSRLPFNSASATDPKTGDTIFAVTTNKEKEKSFDDCRAVVYGSSIIDNKTEATGFEKNEKDHVKKQKKDVTKNSKNAVKDANRKPRKRRWRVRPVNMDRAINGYHRKVFVNVKKMDQEQFFEHTRMSKSLFDWLLTFVQSTLRKNKQTILPEERLVITLNYLAYGTPLQSIAWKHKVGKSTARQIVLNTCSVLWNLLSPIYVSEPTTSQFADIAEDIKSKWDIPNCIGAIDGKHVSIRDPSKSAPINNKTGLSMLILGVCDAKYKFSAVSVGNFNNQSDNGIFQLSSFNTARISDKLHLPSSKPLFPLCPPFPHFFISDISFPLQKNVMRPYVEDNLDKIKTNFNYRISRARIITENTFGILTARFRVLLTTIEFLPESCKTIILACIALHNFIMTNDEDQLYCPANFVDREDKSGIINEGQWRKDLKNNGDQPLPSITSSDIRSSYEAYNLRDTLANFFANESISYEIEIV